MKKIAIVWTIILVIIVSGLTVIGFKIKEKNIDTITEKALKEKTEQYLNVYTVKYPAKGESIRLTYEELKDEGYDAKLEEEGCTGYTIVTNGDMGFEFKSYVKCAEYTTEGYEDATK